jgi:hypothetical protein
MASPKRTRGESSAGVSAVLRALQAPWALETYMVSTIGTSALTIVDVYLLYSYLDCAVADETSDLSATGQTLSTLLRVPAETFSYNDRAIVKVPGNEHSFSLLMPKQVSPFPVGGGYAGGSSRGPACSHGHCSCDHAGQILHSSTSSHNIARCQIDLFCRWVAMAPVSQRALMALSSKSSPTSRR